MDLGLNGRVALVVGASKGIGRAVAEELAREGCRIIAVARDAGLLGALDIGDHGIRIPMDLMLPDAADGIARGMLAITGAPDIIYHAIGGSWNGIKGADSSAAQYAEVWRYNLGIAIEINNAVLPAMIEKRWGRIVHTSSDAVKNSIGNAPYASAKFALEGYVKVASKRFSKHNVILSAVSLGPIHKEGGYLYSQSEADTKSYFDHYLPTQRFGTVEEAAKVVAFMCSEHAGFMAGAVVDVHGGSR